ncbi:NAD(P)H-hydrate epimerase / ADP-dependent (S)-NAD(P)H-hydrate dehydratase [hydrothermal vent metagenome]|uniref:NAD(P)H-hydrate epimerase / ADP-dependent (S)-NAD(P)H-hydrate dehydratase n=1 Tax=hydrothermal vent metagenome TaxID=652676 RepID=A0A3B1DAS0_9ZZZZ
MTRGRTLSIESLIKESKNMERINKLPARPVRPDDAHKGTFGRALIIGGSRGMSGAVSLAGLGALRGGAGLVTLAVPESILSTVAAIEPSYMTIPIPESRQGAMTNEARSDLEKITAVTNAMAVGPGWGDFIAQQSLASWLFQDILLPTVFDADALNGLAKSSIFSSSCFVAQKTKPVRILTPHPGEFSRLTGLSINEIQNNREETAMTFAKQHQIILLLKGKQTVITDGNRIAINQTGNSGMATGGAGDVLTGLIVALLAQGMNGFEAAQLGAHLHGLAGDLAAKELSQQGLIASDLPQYIARAWLELE